MANQSAESFLHSVLPDINDSDAPQDYCDLQISVLQEMETRVHCLRMSVAPSENCPGEVPPAVAGQLECDEQCPERRKAPADLTAETAEKPAALMLRAAA